MYAHATPAERSPHLRAGRRDGVPSRAGGRQPYIAPHASTAHFSAHIMFTALIATAFGKISAGLGAAAENGDAEVVLLGSVRLLAERTAFSGCFSCVEDGSAISSHEAEAVDRRYRVAESNQPCRTNVPQGLGPPRERRACFLYKGRSSYSILPIPRGEVGGGGVVLGAAARLHAVAKPRVCAGA